NDPYNGAMMAQHHAQDVMRAVESDRWMVRVTNTGYSGVVSPRGDTVWRSERNNSVVHLTHIQRRQSRTLYVNWGNWLTVLLMSLAGMMVSVQRWRKG
ncbi:MAG: apolipoprotein N-acyltransferase, partial [Leptolyngbyaceae bacterium]|nr:apolipoprotein N-acyltransferase [Leptolyngbyaceae bacterium]